MLRYIWLAVMIILSLLTGTASAQETASAFRYPVTEFGLDGTYTVSRPYKFQTASGKHDGTDFDYGCGDTIYAAANGVVVKSFGNYGLNEDGSTNYNSGFGELIRIEHVLPDGTIRYTQYAHLLKRYVSEEDPVTYGQPIGEMGSTGYSSGCHLHFQVITEDTRGYGYTNQTGGYWDTFLDPIAFLNDHLGESDQTCDYEDSPIYGDPVDMVFFNAIPDGTDYDISMYSYESDSMTLLDRGDMGSEYTNPVIDNAEPNPENKQRWLAGDVDFDGWDDAIMIGHSSGDLNVQVWLSNGDGTLQEHDTWLTSSTTYDEYLLTPSGDLIAGDDTGSGIDWYKCESNGTSFDSCTYWEQHGGDLDEDVFLAGDFTGNQNPNLLRGYIADDQDETCGVSGHSHMKLRWRLLKSGGEKDTWERDWGCPNADYVVADVNGDLKSDLIQIRHDDSDTGKVFVLTSEGDDFSDSSTWKSDFGSSSHKYWSADLDGDGCSDLINHKDSGDYKINVAYSDCNDDFGSNVTLITDVDKETGGAFRFGYFGELALAIGSEREWVCTTADEYSTSSIETSDGYCVSCVDVEGDSWNAQLAVLDPDDDYYDIQVWYHDGDTDETLDEINASYTLNESNMGDDYMNPVIDDEGQTTNKEKWLAGNVDGDDWTDLVMISHDSGTLKVQVWVSNGDGTFRSREKWYESSTTYDQYFLGEPGELLAGRWVDGDGMKWYTCYIDEGVDGTSACDYWGKLGTSADNAFVAGDFNGDGNTDIVAGYIADDSEVSCPVSGHSHNRMRWRVKRGGSTSNGVWKDDWGCAGSHYVSGDMNGDGYDDLVQVRHDDSSTAPVFVALSDGSDFDDSSEWEDDFGSDDNRYWIFDVNGDGLDDLLTYRDDSYDRIYVRYSDGDDLSALDKLTTGLDKERDGAFRFGNFGQYTEVYEECY